MRSVYTRLMDKQAAAPHPTAPPRSFRLLAALALGLAAQGVIAVESIMVQGLFRDMAIVEIDGKRHKLRAGEPARDGIRLISANSEEAVLEVNGQTDTYRVGTKIAGRFKAPEARPAVQIAPDAMGMYYISGSINGFSTRFLVDTGATHIAMNRNEARRMGINYRLEGLSGQTSTASGITKAWYVTLDRVRVGGIEIRDVSAAVIDGDFPVETLLGNSFLSRLDMARNGRLMELRKP